MDFAWDSGAEEGIVNGDPCMTPQSSIKLEPSVPNLDYIIESKYHYYWNLFLYLAAVQ